MMNETAKAIERELKKRGTAAKAKTSAWFFKTEKGQYGYGDVFLGVTVPEQRVVAKQFRDLPLPEVKKLLCRPLHECRLTALLILVSQYQRGCEDERAHIVQLYLANLKRVNNWDLVDSSAPYILGNDLLNKKRLILDRLARSKNLWERRVAIVATQELIRHGEFADTLRVARILLKDHHDLIHKAVGWMLREVGNRSLATEEEFLKKHATVMPRTMLRYAIEKFPEGKRKRYLTMRPRGNF